MKRKSYIVDDEGFPLSYSQAADRLEISVQALRNKLYAYHKFNPSDIVPIHKLRSKPMRNKLRDHNGKRISQTEAADLLDIKIHKLYRLLFIMRGLYKHVRDGGDIPLRLLEHELTVDGEIMFDIGVVHQDDDDAKKIYLGK